MRRRGELALAAALLAPLAAGSDMACPNSQAIGPSLIQNVCWSCVFPIRIAGVPVSGPERADEAPPGAVRTPVCMCMDNLGVPKPGVTTSLWEPFRLVELERTAGCLSALNGTRLPLSDLFRGTDAESEEENAKRPQTSFRHYHVYSFPILFLLGMFLPARCNPGGYEDIDVMYLSEIDPTWAEDELAFFSAPEAAAVAAASAGTVPACIADALASDAGSPIESLFWCAGSWGLLYPLSGHVSGAAGRLASTSLMAAKAFALQHRRGIERDTVGIENLCGGSVSLAFPKGQYRFQEFWPRAESGNHPVGRNPMIWAGAHSIPGTGEDPIYLVWRWIDCCNTL